MSSIRWLTRYRPIGSLIQMVRRYLSSKKVILRCKGVCPICEKMCTFSAENDWLRDNFLCSGCLSIPRERALMHVIKTTYPNYRELVIHESSPSNRGVSPKLKSDCPNYSASQFFDKTKRGEYDSLTKWQCQDIENLTFDDASIDLFITQDVMEHIFDAESAFKEICRVLKPGGAHIFTVPLINKGKKSEIWASRDASGKVDCHQEPEWHGNPISDKGSLVTMHWGYDIAEFIAEVAKTPTEIITIDNIDMGIRAEYIDVLVSRKPAIG